MIAFDNLHRSRACLFDRWALIAAIAADFFDEWKAVGQLVEDKCRSVAILNARRVDGDVTLSAT
ncbi:hypothetical protein [Rhizobium leguminosarum]|uniref:hypothetical protein n=1 Tax=Rhizobium leguminosarum TaxID=384 RepID=UPI001649AF34|nr:hypothetical protein [Rhizobium leguminosarum]